MSAAEDFFFASADGTQLEARLTYLKDNGPPAAVVVCFHPYPPLGGQFRNNVLEALSDKFILAGLACFRVNFRGAGQSHGRTSWTGASEVADATAAVENAMNRFQQAKIIICGYSYGALIGCSLAEYSARIIGFVAISFPFGVAWALTSFGVDKFLEGAKSNKPKLFVIGASDNFTSIALHTKATNEFPDPKTVHVHAEADHFWHGYEHEISDYICTWIKSRIRDGGIPKL